MKYTTLCNIGLAVFTASAMAIPIADRSDSKRDADAVNWPPFKRAAAKPVRARITGEGPAKREAKADAEAEAWFHQPVQRIQRTTATKSAVSTKPATVNQANQVNQGPVTLTQVAQPFDPAMYTASVTKRDAEAEPVFHAPINRFQAHQVTSSLSSAATTTSTTSKRHKKHKSSSIVVHAAEAVSGGPVTLIQTAQPFDPAMLSTTSSESTFATVLKRDAPVTSTSTGNAATSSVNVISSEPVPIFPTAITATNMPHYTAAIMDKREVIQEHEKREAQPVAEPKAQNGINGLINNVVEQVRPQAVPTPASGSSSGGNIHEDKKGRKREASDAATAPFGVEANPGNWGNNNGLKKGIVTRDETGNLNLDAPFGINTDPSKYGDKGLKKGHKRDAEAEATFSSMMHKLSSSSSSP